MCKAINKNYVCCIPTYSKKFGLLVPSFRILDRFFQIFFTWIIGGRVRQRCTLGITVSAGRLTVLDNCIAVGAGGGLDYHLPLFLSFHID